MSDEPGYFEILLKRSEAYRQVFAKDSPHARIVLADLMRFCKFMRAPWGKDDAERCNRIGRQEVLHRIIETLNIEPGELIEMARRDEHQ